MNSATLLTDVCIVSLSDGNTAEFQSVSVSEREGYSDTTKPNSDTQSMAA